VETLGGSRIIVLYGGPNSLTVRGSGGENLPHIVQNTNERFFSTHLPDDALFDAAFAELLRPPVPVVRVQCGLREPVLEASYRWLCGVGLVSRRLS